MVVVMDYVIVTVRVHIIYTCTCTSAFTCTMYKQINVDDLYRYHCEYSSTIMMYYNTDCS